MLVGWKLPGLAGHLAIERHARALEIHHVDHRLQERGLHPLALAGRLALEQRHGHPIGREDAAAEVGDRDADAKRAVARDAGDRHQPAHALRDLVESGPARVGAGLAEARDARVDQARIDLRERLVVDAEAVLHVGTEVLQQHVGLLDQLLQHRDALRLLQVERDRALVPVRVLVVRAFLAAERVVAAHAVGHLHLDHVGAPVGELARGGGAGAHLGQVEDAEAGKGLRGGSVGHGLIVGSGLCLARGGGGVATGATGSARRARRP
jgi:hypothetical protein